MAKIFGQDVPTEYAALYDRIIKATGNTTAAVISQNYPSRSRVKKTILKNNSLMVLWQSLYDSFSSDRRHGWDLYWGGWPGSGYSSFIQVNAPRYKLGLSLLLDPPVGPELITNGDFTTDLSDWDGYRQSWDAGQCLLTNPGFNPIEGQLLQDGTTMVDGGFYQVSLDLVIPDGIQVVVSLGNPNYGDETDNFEIIDSNGSVPTTYPFTAYCRYDVDSGYTDSFHINLLGSEVEDDLIVAIDNVSVRLAS